MNIAMTKKKDFLKTPQNLGLNFFRSSRMNWNCFFVYLIPLANHIARFFNQQFTKTIGFNRGVGIQIEKLRFTFLDKLSGILIDA